MILWFEVILSLLLNVCVTAAALSPLTFSLDQTLKRMRKKRMRSFEESKASTLVPRIFHTNLDGDFACYGHIFDLKSTGEGFNVTAISLHLDTEETVRVSVFKKLGSSLRYSDAGSNPWVEIHNGFVHGHGKGRFSKISELSPIVVKERSVVALYITIKSNQMLCSELPLELGAPLYSNDDLKISVGANIKVYPFYGSPMDLSHGGWNGYLEYRLESETPEIMYEPSRTVQSQTATYQPITVYPSTPPSTCITNVPRSLGTVKGFEEETSFYKTYGIMFDVVAKSDPVAITNIGFYTDAYVGDDVSYKVYTKVGFHEGSERTSSAWNLHASGTVPSKGPLTETQILEFSNIHMDSQYESKQMISFYITLDQDSLLQDRKSSTIQTENSDLYIFVGTPVSTYPPFSHESGQEDDSTHTLLTPKRAFRGTLYYESFISCSATILNPPSSSPTTTVNGMVETTVPFLFAIEYDANDQQEFATLVSIDGTVESKIFEQLRHNTEMSGFFDSGQILWKGAFSRDRDNTMRSCVGRCSVVIETTVVVQHKFTIPRELIRYYFLREASVIASSFKFSGEYLGLKTSETDISIALNNVDANLLESSDYKYLEETTKTFLNEQLLKFETPARISMVMVHEGRSVEVNEIEVPSNSSKSHKRFRPNRFLVSNNETRTLFSTEFYATITGEYQPPPDINFSLVVEDSFAEPERFLLKMKENKNFAGVDHVDTVIVRKRHNNFVEEETPYFRDRPSFTYRESILVYGTVGIVLTLIVVYFALNFKSIQVRRSYRKYDKYFS